MNAKQVIRLLRQTESPEVLAAAKVRAEEMQSAAGLDADLVAQYHRAIRDAEYRILGPGAGSLRDKIRAASDRLTLGEYWDTAGGLRQSMSPKTWRRIASAHKQRLAELSGEGSHESC